VGDQEVHDCMVMEPLEKDDVGGGHGRLGLRRSKIEQAVAGQSENQLRGWWHGR
jgi:hypothetical protein